MAKGSDRYWRKPTLQHAIEYAAARSFAELCRLLPIDTGSNLSAALGRLVGPMLSANRRIGEGLRLVWPDIDAAEVRRISRGVWDNFARVPNDYWNLDRIRKQQDARIEIVGAEHLRALRDGDRPGILFAAHLGEWEMVTLAARRHDLPLTVVYRPINNPYIDAYVRDLQRTSGVELIMKGREGARRLTQVLKGGGHTIMLVDVRMNDGVMVPFLGHDAMTPAAPAALALKYDALLMPVRVERTGPANFRVTFEEPRPAVDTGNRAEDIAATMTWVNERIGAWIRARPEQWMWLHRRWGKDAGRREERQPSETP
jgi:KDO2-lipid IV(A) lauroyltransferase